MLNEPIRFQEIVIFFIKKEIHNVVLVILTDCRHHSNVLFSRVLFFFSLLKRLGYQLYSCVVVYK